MKASGGTPATAVGLFQQTAGMQATGIADNETQIRLFADDAPYAPGATTPTPAPSIQTMQITWIGNQSVTDYSGLSFGARKGDVYQNFKVSWFPIDVVAIPVWSSSDENVVTVDPVEGVETTLRFVGNSGDTATISVDVNGTVRSFDIRIN